MKINCNVIRDLLPLYEDGAVSKETAELVREHLKDCPDCREELRKMRVPISLPPDEDEAAVRRFLARQAELRRKQNKKMVRILIPLALVLVFCLCYALIPRSWAGISGEADPDWLMGSYHSFTFRLGEPDIEVWTLNKKDDPDAEVANGILDALGSASYRAELRNLLNYIPFVPKTSPGVQGLDGSVTLELMKDDTVVASVILYGMRQDCQINSGPAGKPYTSVYHTDRDVFDVIAELMMEYGEFHSET